MVCLKVVAEAACESKQQNNTERGCSRGGPQQLVKVCLLPLTYRARFTELKMTTGTGIRASGHFGAP